MYVVGVDLGRMNIRCAVVSAVADEYGKILGEDRRLTLSDRPAAQILGDIAGSIIVAANNAGVPPADLAAVGIGAPGPLDPVRGMLLDVPNWASFQNLPLGGLIRQRLGVKTVIANDVDCFTLGEYAFGAGRNFQGETMFGVAIGSGFGGGCVHEGKLFRGMGMAPEPGHTDVRGIELLCACGEWGHAEAALSGYGLPKLAECMGLHIASAEELYQKLHEGDEGARRKAEEVVRQASQYLSRVLVNIVHNFHPSVIVVGGSIAKLGAPFLDEAYRLMQDEGLQSMIRDVLIVPAELGDNAGILGAARLALDLAQGGAK